MIERIIPLLRWTMVCIASIASIAIISQLPVFREAILFATLILAAILWRWPHAIWYLIPGILATVNLMPFTGWVWLGESDAMLLAGLAVLWIRKPDVCNEWPGLKVIYWPILLLALANLMGVVIAMVDASPDRWTSDNPYIHPFNAWRASKGVWCSLLFLPSLIRSSQRGIDVFHRLAWGIIGACAVVCTFGIAERYAFPGLWNLKSDYRIVGTWFDMHLGGSQIAIFLAIALPILVGMTVQGAWWRMLFFALCSIATLTVLIVTYARAGIVVGGLGLSVLLLLTLLSLRTYFEIAFSTFLPSGETLNRSWRCRSWFHSCLQVVRSLCLSVASD